MWSGATPPAHMRPNHPAAKRATQTRPRRPAQRRTDETETVLGRNPVVECLRAGVPATALYVALGTEADERLTESVSRAADLGIAILEVPRSDLDKMTTNHLHQGIALQVPPYNYAHPDDLLTTALQTPPALLVTVTPPPLPLAAPNPPTLSVPLIPDEALPPLPPPPPTDWAKIP